MLFDISNLMVLSWMLVPVYFIERSNLAQIEILGLPNIALYIALITKLLNVYINLVLYLVHSHHGWRGLAWVVLGASVGITRYYRVLSPNITASHTLGAGHEANVPDATWPDHRERK